MQGSNLGHLLPVLSLQTNLFVPLSCMAPTMSADLRWFICHTVEALAKPFCFICVMSAAKQFAILPVPHNLLAVGYQQQNTGCNVRKLAAE